MSCIERTLRLPRRVSDVPMALGTRDSQLVDFRVQIFLRQRNANEAGGFNKRPHKWTDGDRPYNASSSLEMCHSDPSSRRTFGGPARGRWCELGRITVVRIFNQTEILRYRFEGVCETPVVFSTCGV